MSEKSADLLLAEKVEEMAHAAFGLEKTEETRKAAREIAGLLRRLAGIPLDQGQEPFVPEPKERRDGTQD